MRSVPPRAQHDDDVDPVAYAKAHATSCLRVLVDIAENGGNRGAAAQTTAARLVLEVARVIGSQREEPAKLDAVKEAAKVIYLVDAEKAQELLAAQRAAERKP